MTDKELLKKLKKDKNKGLSLVIDLYSGLLYKIASGILLPLGTAEDVEECISDSFLAFYGELERIDPEKASIKTYLAVIAKRKAIDRYRRLKKFAVLTQYGETDGYEIPAEDFTAANDTKKALADAVMSLGEPDTTIVTRKFYLGETAAEIAAALGMSEGAVQKRIERSRTKLKAELGGVLNG